MIDRQCPKNASNNLHKLKQLTNAENIKLKLPFEPYIPKATKWKFLQKVPSINQSEKATFFKTRGTLFNKLIASKAMKTKKL